jgi:phenylpyruvate tautomerase PptA (4-oxalocrotonate tautomerase family)
MPSVLIEVRRHYTPDQEIALMDAVHTALRDTLKLLPGDWNVRLEVHEPHRFAYPPDRAQGEYYTHISIDLFAGRTLDTKRKLYRAIVDSLAPLGVPRDHVKILLREISRENWGVRGGQAACDVALGFEIEVWQAAGKQPANSQVRSASVARMQHSGIRGIFWAFASINRTTNHLRRRVAISRISRGPVQAGVWWRTSCWRWSTA